MGTIANIAIGLIGKTATFARSMSSAGDVMQKFAYQTKAAQRQFNEGWGKMKTFTLATGAALGASAHMAAAFMEKMSNVATIAGVGQSGMKALTDQVLALSDATGRGPEELAESLYQTISAGKSAATAMQLVETAAKGAIAGVGTTAEAVDHYTNVINSNIATQYSLQRIADITQGTIKAGKTTMGELSKSMGQVLPYAQKLGVSLEDLFSGVATMTKGGVNTANTATALKELFSSIMSPTPAAAAAAKKMKIDLSPTAIKTGGLVKFMDDLYKKTNGNAQAMRAIIPSNVAMLAAFKLTGENASTLTQIQADLINSTNEMGKAFATVAAEAALKFAIELRKLQNYAVRLGMIVVPAFLKVVEAARDIYNTFPRLTTAFVSVVGGAIMLNASGVIPLTRGLAGMAAKLPLLIKGFSALAIVKDLALKFSFLSSNAAMFVASILLMSKAQLAASLMAIAKAGTAAAIPIMIMAAKAAALVAVVYAIYQVTAYLSEAIGLTDTLASVFQRVGETLGLFEQKMSNYQIADRMKEQWSEMVKAGKITEDEFKKRMASIDKIATSATAAEGFKNQLAAGKIDTSEYEKRMAEINKMAGVVTAAAAPAASPGAAGDIASGVGSASRGGSFTQVSRHLMALTPVGSQATAAQEVKSTQLADISAILQKIYTKPGLGLG